MAKHLAECEHSTSVVISAASNLERVVKIGDIDVT
jgi:hypothetical protein